MRRWSPDTALTSSSAADGVVHQQLGGFAPAAAAAAGGGSGRGPQPLPPLGRLPGRHDAGFARPLPFGQDVSLALVLIHRLCLLVDGREGTQSSGSAPRQPSHPQPSFPRPVLG